MELIHIWDSARSVAPANRENRILPGKKATYRIRSTKTVRSMVVGSYFNFITEEAVPCSHPLARELTGKKTGETCIVTIHGKTLRLSALDIGFPSPMN